MGLIWLAAAGGLYHRPATRRYRARHARGRAWNRAPRALALALTAPLAPLAALYARPRPRPLPAFIPCPAVPR